jgi:hypothetical protein
MTTELERKWFGKTGYMVRDSDVTEKFEITASPLVMERFKRFLTFLVHNGGHSGIFGMYFDGDGADFLRTKPKLDRKYTKAMHAMAGVGVDVEIAGDDGYTGEFLDRDRAGWIAADGSKDAHKEGEAE